MAAEGEDDWLFDYMLTVLRAPTWEVPIMTFIDENCVIFDNEEENKLVYHDKFDQFRTLVDNLLSQHLSDVGITEEQFARSCELNADKRDVNKKVFDQLIAVDDFLTFKKLMVKRNVELELEVVQGMKNAGVTLQAPGSKEEEEEALRQVMEASAAETQASSKEAGGKQADPSAEAQRAQQLEEATQLKQAMEANLLEMQLYAKQMELEQAELEKALALSLQLEEKRLEKLKLEKELAEVEKRKQEAEVQREKALAAAKAAEDEDARRRAQEAADEAARERQRLAEERARSEAKAREAAKRERRRRQREEEEEARRQAEAASSKSSRNDGGARDEGKQAAQEGKSCTQDAEGKTSSSMSSLSALPSLTASPMRPKFSVDAIHQLDDNLHQKKQAAKQQFRLNQQENEERARQQEELRRRAKISEAEMKRRAEYLRKQRDLLIKRKNEARQRELDQYRATHTKEDSRREFKKVQASVEAAAAAVSPADKKKMSEAQKRRAAMMKSLGMGLKKEIVREEQRRTSEIQEQQFSELDQQLRLAEKQRHQRQRKQQELMEEMRNEKLYRALNVQSSSYANRIIHDERDYSFKES